MIRRGFILLALLSAVAASACTYDPKYDANGIKCKEPRDCPSGYLCVNAAASGSGVCCNKPDATVCLSPPVSGQDSAIPDVAAPATPDALSTPDVSVAPTDLAANSEEGGQVVCEPDCVGKECGPDGCNGNCGPCTGGRTCTPAGRCN
jgi:hypothetical protein